MKSKLKNFFFSHIISVRRCSDCGGCVFLKERNNQKSNTKTWLHEYAYRQFDLTSAWNLGGTTYGLVIGSDSLLQLPKLSIFDRVLPNDFKCEFTDSHCQIHELWFEEKYYISIMFTPFFNSSSSFHSSASSTSDHSSAFLPDRIACVACVDVRNSLASFRHSDCLSWHRFVMRSIYEILSCSQIQSQNVKESHPAEPLIRDRYPIPASPVQSHCWG